MASGDASQPRTGPPHPPRPGPRHAPREARRVRGRGLHPASGRAFTLLELVLVVAVIGLLASFAAQRLLALRAEAERASVEQVLGGLRAAVSIEVLSHISAGRDEALVGIDAGNPMEYLAEVPAGYAGALEDPSPEDVAPGRWYFDLRQRLLVYRVRYPDRLVSELSGPARVRFRVELLFDDRNGNDAFDPGVDGVGGARVVAAEPYRWRS